jgi:hypothetical protein
MKIVRMLAVGVAALLVSSCAGHPVIADISQDKVILQGNNAPENELMAKANEACAMYKRRATPLSQRCGDQYCIQKYFLFSCHE